MEPSKIKKRAARACSFCRGRKVRCIVTGPSEACTNCKYHEKPCTRTGIYPQSPGTYSESASTPRSSSITSYHDSVRATTDGAAPVLDTATPISLEKQRLYSQSSSYASDISVAKTPLTIPASIDFSKPSSLSLSGPPPPTVLPETQARSTRPTCHPTYFFLRTPDFNGILSQDLSFLISQGCFMVPQKAVLDEFIEQYFRHVHPMLPLLSEADVCRAYKLGDPDCEEEDKMSILVLQGILFTSCGFVSLDTLSALGFQTHQESKWAFYRRAKLLYDFGCESSPITKAQGALLLAQSHLIPRPLAGNTPFGSIWLSVAIHFAREANAHRYASDLPDDCPDPTRARKRQNVLKRLWWCCIICDRVFPLSSRRDIKITKANFDFYNHPILASEDLEDEMYMSSVYNPTTKALLAEVLQKYIELCIVLTDVLTVTSVLHNHPTWGNTTSAQKLNSSKDQLQQWYSTWSGLRDTVEERSAKEGLAGSNGSITMFTKLLDMYYYSARQALCHSEILQYSIAGSPCLLPYALEKTDELQSANSRVTECLVELNNARSTRWLPMTAIGCTALPLALHLIDAELLRQESEQGPCSDTVTLFANYKRSRLMNLSEAMDTYRPKYYIVDWVVKAVWHIVHLARQFLSSIAVHNGVMGLFPTSWTELLQLMPSSYLRLVITLEMSISHGKIPEESDFPPTLRTSAEISFSIPNMGKYLESDTPPRQSPEKNRREEEEQDRRVTEIVDENANFSTNLDFGTAMDSLGDELVFQTPRTHQQDKVTEVNPVVEPPPPMPSASMDTSTGLDAFDGTFQGEDEFDEWANRVLGFNTGFL